MRRVAFPRRRAAGGARPAEELLNTSVACLLCETLAREGAYDGLRDFSAAFPRLAPHCSTYLEPARRRRLAAVMEALNLLGPAYTGGWGLGDLIAPGAPPGYVGAALAAIRAGDASLGFLDLNPGAEEIAEPPPASALRPEDLAGAYFEIHYNRDYAGRLAALTVPAEQVVVMYDWPRRRGWLQTCVPPEDEWYEGPVGGEATGPLPPLSTRPYVEVVNPFWKVEVSAREKGAPVTVDDVLFASRALMRDARRRAAGGFEALCSSGELLFLQAGIDNCPAV
jgi:hypothetical protein